ncbi:MAG TPA: hypothetical protein DCO75_03805, partial [Fibrobacteres bacterium]|nr:hypothetical protein [Fibrobacterota bacterium]
MMKNDIKIKNKSKPEFRLFEFVAEKFIASIAFISIAFIILILLFVLRESLPLILGRATDDVGRVTLKSLLTLTWRPVSNSPMYGIIALMVGSLKVTLISMMFAFPVAISAALYTSTFASHFSKEIM